MGQFDAGNQHQAKLIAAIVRSELENLHAAGGITDAAMRDLNPVVRNSVYTFFHCLLAAQKGDPKAKAFLEMVNRLIPDYWEEAKLLPSYTELLGR